MGMDLKIQLLARKRANVDVSYSTLAENAVDILEDVRSEKQSAADALGILSGDPDATREAIRGCN